MWGPTRFLTERQWLGWFARRQGLSPEDAVKRVDLDALLVAMQAPVRLRKDGRTDREYFVAQLSILLSLMVSRPPFPFDHRRIAYETVDLICALHGGRLALTDRERTELAGERGRGPAPIAVLERWVADNLREFRGREKIETQMQAFGLLNAPLATRPVLFVSLERTRLEDAEREGLASVVAEIRRRAESVAAELHPSWPSDEPELVDDNEDEPVADAYPGRIEIHAPAVDHPWWEPQDTCRSNRSVLWRANAHVTLAPYGGSEGTGEERGMTPPDAQHLFVEYKTDKGPSPAVVGNLSAHVTKLKFVNNHGEVAGVFEAWLRDAWLAVELSLRHAELRLIQLGPLAEAFATTLDGLDVDQQRAAVALAGLDVLSIPALTDPHGLRWLGSQAYAAAASALGFRARDHLPQTYDFSLSRAQNGALLGAVTEIGIGGREAHALIAEAERQNAIGILRLSLTSVGDWADFREQLRAELEWPW